MRPVYGSDLKLAAKGDRATVVRVVTKNRDGTEIDLTALFGRDFVDEVQLDGQVDQPVCEARITLAREIDFFTLAPLVSESKANHIGTAGALLADGRYLRIDLAWVPSGMDASAVSTEAQEGWHNVFEGAIYEIDWGADQVQVLGRDKAHQVTRCFMKREMIYGLWPTGNGLQVWREGLSIQVGDWVAPSDFQTLPYGYTATVAGNTGLYEPGDNGNPAWPTVIGQTVTDGGVTWRCEGAQTSDGVPLETIIQAMLNQHLGAGVMTLVTPDSPSWNVKAFKPERGPLLDSIRNLALQIGWDVRLLWNQGMGRFDLTLYSPDRTPALPDWTFGPDNYTDVRKAFVSSDGVRNDIEVVYSDSTDLDISGQPKRKRLCWTDAASIAAYGDLYMEISEASSSVIDTPAEAARMVGSALADLSTPLMEFDVEMPLWWPVELGDYLKFSANGVHFTDDQQLAVVSYQHRINRDAATTRLSTRGKPCVAWERWHARGAGRGGARADDDIGTRKPKFSDIIIGQTVKGLKVSHKPPVAAHGAGKWRETEVHVSSVNGFVPSAGTLVAKGAQTDFFIGNLNSKSTYYVRLVSVDDRGRRSPPTPQMTAVPQQAALIDLDDHLKVATALYVSGAGSVMVSGGSEGQVALTHVIFDDGSGYSADDDGFAAPSAGIYRVYARARCESTVAHLDPPEFDAYLVEAGTYDAFLKLKVNRADGAAHCSGLVRRLSPGGQVDLDLQTLVALAQGDLLQLFVNYGASAGSTYVAKSSVLFIAERVWSR